MLVTTANLINWVLVDFQAFVWEIKGIKYFTDKNFIKLMKKQYDSLISVMELLPFRGNA